MNTELLASMVKDLVLERDEVFIPGLGSFVAEVVPAYFSDKGFTLNPPYRRLFFRGRADSEDKSLVSLYAEANGIGEAEAFSLLSDFSAQLKDRLLADRTLALPGLGKLRMTRENNIFFVADENLDIYPEGFGLDTVSLKSGDAVVAGEPQIVMAGLTGHLSAEEDSRSVLRQAQQPPGMTSEEPRHGRPEEVRHGRLDRPSRRSVKPLVWSLGGIAAAFIIAAAAFFALARFAPDTLDRMLYTAEELDIINRYSEVISK